MATVKTRSLFRRLLIGFVLVMLGVWACAMGFIAENQRSNLARETAIINQAAAHQIMLGLRPLAGHDGELRAAAAAMEETRLRMHKELGFMQCVRTVILRHKRLVYASALKPGALHPADKCARKPAGNGWLSRVEHDAATGLTVERRVYYDGTWMFTYSAAGFWLTPLAYCLPFLLLPAWLIIRVGLRPLRTMVAAIEQRSASDLAAMPDSPYRELAPLVNAINGHMTRLRVRIEREQEFLSDAAHELKTPLAVIQLNAHLLDSDADQDRRRAAGAGLRFGVARARHAVHQLLAFERAQSDPGARAAPQLDLATLLRDRLAIAAPLALQRQIDIELHAGQACLLPLHFESMAALLDNVIDNAIKYSPDTGRIDVKLDVAADNVRLSVNDQGPGIAADLRTRVFERFYRVPGQDQDGSGLGLAIAERAAVRNGAAIRLFSGAGGRGLAVIIEFLGAERRAVEDFGLT